MCSMISLAVFGWFAVTASSAQASIEEVAARENAANQAAQSVEFFRTARDQAALGDAGFVEAMRAYRHKATTWIDAWTTFQGTLAEARFSCYEDVERTVVLFLRAEADLRSDLEQQALRVRNRHARLTSLLKAGSHVLESVALQEQIDELQAKRAGIAADAAVQMRKINALDGRIQRFSEQYTATRLLLKVKERMLASGLTDVDQALINAQDLITAETVLEPILASIRVDGLVLNTDVLNLYYTASSNDAARLTDKCQRAKDTLIAMDIAPAYKSAAVKQVDTSCASYLDLFESLRTAYTRQEIAVYMQKEQVEIYATRCKVATSIYDCSRFSWLKNLNEQQIRSYSWSDLDLLENNWKTMGPS